MGWKLSSCLNSQTRRVVMAKNQPQNLQVQHSETSSLCNCLVSCH